MCYAIEWNRVQHGSLLQQEFDCNHWSVRWFIDGIAQLGRWIPALEISDSPPLIVAFNCTNHEAWCSTRVCVLYARLVCIQMDISYGKTNSRWNRIQPKRVPDTDFYRCVVKVVKRGSFHTHLSFSLIKPSTRVSPRRENNPVRSKHLIVNEPKTETDEKH